MKGVSLLLGNPESVLLLCEHLFSLFVLLLQELDFVLGYPGLLLYLDQLGLVLIHLLVQGCLMGNPLLSYLLLERCHFALLAHSIL